MHYIALRVAPGSETLAGFKGDAALNAHALPRSGFVQHRLCVARDYAESLAGNPGFLLVLAVCAPHNPMERLLAAHYLS